MPQIGTLGTKKRISQDVGRTPTVNLDQAGRVGRAIQGLGGAVGKVGKDIARHEAQKNSIKSNSFKNRGRTNVKNMVLEFSNATDLKHKGGDYSGSSDEIMAFSTKAVNDYADTARDPAESRRFKESMQPYLEKIRIQSIGKQDLKSINYSNNELNDNITANAGIVEANPTKEVLADALATVELSLAEARATNQVNGPMYEKLQGRKSLLPQSYVSGKLRQGYAEAEAIIGTSNKIKYASEDIKSVGLNPKDEAIAIKQATKMMEMLSESQDREIDSNIDEGIKILGGGKRVSPVIFESIQDRFRGVASYNDPKAGKAAAGRIELAENVYAETHLAGQISNGDILELKLKNDRAIVDTKDLGEYSRMMSYKKEVAKSYDQRYTKRIKFPHASALEEMPSLEGNPAALADYQVSQGYLNLAVVSPQKATLDAKGITDGNTAEERGAFLDTALERMPDSRTRGIYLKQMIDVGGLPKVFKAASNFDSGNIRELILKNDTNADDINKASEINEDYDKTTFDTYMKKKFSKVSSTFASAGADSVLGAMYRSVGLDAKVAMNGDGTGAEEAIAASFKKLISNNFVQAELSGANLIVPNNAGVTVSTINDFDEFNHSPEYLKSLNISKARSMSTLSEDQWFKELSDSAAWVPNGEGTGVVLKFHHPTDGLIVKSNNDGARIEVMYEDMAGEVARGVKMDRRATAKRMSEMELPFGVQ